MPGQEKMVLDYYQKNPSAAQSLKGSIYEEKIISLIKSKIKLEVKNINTNPGPLDPYDFALRASANTWKEFSQPMPKPMYHGIWSASFRKDLKIEGNHLILMKNLRNL